jgi:ferredoxin
MTWRLEVDTGACIGSGICASLSPELFALRGAHAEVLREGIEPDEQALEAADFCPASAITVTDGGQVIAPRP